MAEKTIQEQGKPVTIKDEGLTLAASVSSIDFAGAGVSGATIGDDVTETIAGTSGSGIDDLNDVTISSPSSNQVLTYNGSAWVNAAASSS